MPRIFLTDTSLVVWPGVETDGSDIIIEAIGGGGGGDNGNNRCGGGGAGYAKIKRPYVSCAAVNIQIGNGGIGGYKYADSGDGEDTTWDTTVLVAEGGNSGKNGGNPGAYGGSLGNTGNHGGWGSSGVLTPTWNGGGGGGGAGGPDGPGAEGGTHQIAGAGGGGANGGSAGSNSVEEVGADGGDNADGIGHGVGDTGTGATAGTVGGGGGGGRYKDPVPCIPGADGGAGTEFDSSHGGGGGGGGAGGNNGGGASKKGGNGGLYGGGGGGADNGNSETAGGDGAQGLIIITYTDNDFSASPLNAIAGFSAAFTSTIETTPVSVLWDFGDGQTSTELNPTHAYAAAGVYSVILTIVDSEKTITITKTNYITVTALDFTGTPLIGYEKLETSFSLNTFESVESVLWDFGDGQTSEESKPTHLYTMPGKYTVTATVTSDSGDEVIIEKEDYVRVFDIDFSDASKDSSLSDTCYRLPTKTGHGYGPSEYKDGDTAGYDWLWPSSGPETALCFDDYHTEIALVNDAKKQRVYRINDPACWNDRENEYGGGNRIISEIHLRQEHSAAGEHVPIRFIEQHLTFKPFDTDLKDVTGFDIEGFPIDMRVDLLLHKNGSLNLSKKAVKITKNGDLVVQGPLEGRNLQSRIKIYEAPWLFTRAMGYYDTIDKAAAPALRKMTEADYQEELGSMPLLRVARSFGGLLNLATGADSTGTIGSLVTGPDGRENSAILFSGEPFGFSDTLPEDLDGDFSLLSWISAVFRADLPLILWQCGNLMIYLADGGGKFQLAISDGVNPAITQDLELSGLDWTLLSVVRDGMNLYIYENKTLKGVYGLNSIENYGALLEYGQMCPCSHADATVLPRKVSAEALEYYYDDVIDSEGEAVMPLF